MTVISTSSMPSSKSKRLGRFVPPQSGDHVDRKRCGARFKNFRRDSKSRRARAVARLPERSHAILRLSRRRYFDSSGRKRLNRFALRASERVRGRTQNVNGISVHGRAVRENAVFFEPRIASTRRDGALSGTQYARTFRICKRANASSMRARSASLATPRPRYSRTTL